MAEEMRWRHLRREVGWFSLAISCGVTLLALCIAGKLDFSVWLAVGLAVASGIICFPLSITVVLLANQKIVPKRWHLFQRITVAITLALAAVLVLVAVTKLR